MPDQAPAIAYSYIRFSHPDQAKGDSLRRQEEAAREWCARNGVRLDTSTTLHDLGRSAYTGAHRQNADRNALAAFLKLVEQDKVQRGSYLIIENLDRLSREHIQPALLLALNLLQAGIRVVQLKPAEMIFDDKSDTLPVMMMMMELSRGHGESAIKAERVGAAWAEKKRKAAEKPVTERLPAWVEMREDKLRLIPDKAETVRLIFQLARDGYGIGGITMKLNRDRVATIAQGKHWARSSVGKILHNRAVIGEYQPHTRRGGSRRPDGEPIPNYFPAVIGETEWHAARAGLVLRKTKAGRPAKAGVNIFMGLLRDARDGSSMTYQDKGKKGGMRLLVSSAALNGLPGSRVVSFPFPIFERAVLSLLHEIDPKEIIGDDQAGNEVMALTGERGTVEARIGKLEAELLEGDVPSLARALRGLEERKRDLTTKLAGARMKAATPLSQAWGEAQSLLGTLNQAEDPEDCRTRLRGALRRIVSQIWCLFVRRGRDRLAAVQVWFAEGKRCRSYLILHRPPKANASARREGGWWARSLATDAVPGELDLRDCEHARRLARVLESVDLASLTG